MTGRRLACAAWAVTLSGCNHVQSTLDATGEQAAAIGQVWNLMLAVCVPIYVLVMIAMALAVRRLSRNAAATTEHDRAIGRGMLTWSLVIAGLLSVLVVTSFSVDRRLNRPALQPLQVRITARQWWWQIDYLDADLAKRFTTANELHLPLDRDTRIELVANDVIHSLWIPTLNGKEDLIPGRTNTITLTPHRVGWFRGQCAEFCGLQHALMALEVRVEDGAAFARWREHQIEPGPAPRSPEAIAGKQLFESGQCMMCHAISGTDAGARNGPDLTHLASRRTIAAATLPLDRATLQSWIADPQKFKPGALMPAVPLTEQQRANVVDYLMGLR
jgi:cytochrome c oxidase subunit II